MPPTGKIQRELQQLATNDGLENVMRINNRFFEHYPIRVDDDEADSIFDCIQLLWRPGMTYAKWYEVTVKCLITGGSNAFPLSLPKTKTGPVTRLDSLYPITDRIKHLQSDLTAIKIQSPIMQIEDVQCGIEGAVVIAAVAIRIAPRDENDVQKVKKRGFELRGPTLCLNMWLRDDSDVILCKIERFDYERLALEVIERGKAGKAIYAIKGTVPLGFRMIKVQRLIYLGDMHERMKW